MKRKGFSLVELLIVIAMLAILMAITIPQFTAFVPFYQSKEAANSVKHLLETAKLKSASDYLPIRFVLDCSRGANIANKDSYFNYGNGACTAELQYPINRERYAVGENNPVFTGYIWKRINEHSVVLPSGIDFRFASYDASLKDTGKDVEFASTAVKYSPQLKYFKADIAGGGNDLDLNGDFLFIEEKDAILTWNAGMDFSPRVIPSDKAIVYVFFPNGYVITPTFPSKFKIVHNQNLSIEWEISVNMRTGRISLKK